jgi:hypothetical protein
MDRPKRTEYNAWKKMRMEWPSENDAYNLAVYGITKCRFYELNRLAMDAVGSSFAGSCKYEEMTARFARNGGMVP